jgi:hypothetical protein
MKSSRFTGKVAAVATGVAIAAVSFGAAPASATTGTAQTPPTVAEMKFYDDYWTLEECTTVGDWGLNVGKWTVYDCQFSGWDYDLYYDS